VGREEGEEGEGEGEKGKGEEGAGKGKAMGRGPGWSSTRERGASEEGGECLGGREEGEVKGAGHHGSRTRRHDGSRTACTESLQHLSFLSS
jgi:hypothetical protein